MLCAQEIELPAVQWLDADGKTIHPGKVLELQFKTDVPTSELRARIFCEVQTGAD
jgi:hypothetical protein